MTEHVMDLDLRPEEILSREQVGWHAGAPVFMVECSGGISYVYEVRNGHAVMLGHGPHPGVSKGIAKKMEPALQFSELHKADERVDPKGRIFQRYEALTREIRRVRHGK